jgi:hypothetical protein
VIQQMNTDAFLASVLDFIAIALTVSEQNQTFESFRNDMFRNSREVCRPYVRKHT